MTVIEKSGKDMISRDRREKTGLNVKRKNKKKRRRKDRRRKTREVKKNINKT